MGKVIAWQTIGGPYRLMNGFSDPSQPFYSPYGNHTIISYCKLPSILYLPWLTTRVDEVPRGNGHAWLELAHVIIISHIIIASGLAGVITLSGVRFSLYGREKIRKKKVKPTHGIIRSLVNKKRDPKEKVRRHGKKPKRVRFQANEKMFK